MGYAGLTNSPAIDFEPDWSPDGARIAFATDRDGNEGQEIYVMNADGTGDIALPAVGSADVDPSWRP